MGQNSAKILNLRKNALTVVPAAKSDASMLWAFRLLQVAMAVLLAGAGADKFFQVSMSWNEYVPAVLPWTLGTDVSTFLSGIGIFELILAFGIAIAPGYFGAVASLWMIFANLVLMGGGDFRDLSVIDLALAISAFSLSALGQVPGIATLHLLRRKRFHFHVPSYLRFHEAP